MTARSFTASGADTLFTSGTNKVPLENLILAQLTVPDLILQGAVALATTC